MRLSEVVGILARRLHRKRARVAAIANRLQHAGFLPLAESRRFPPEVPDDNVTDLFLAVVADRGLHLATDMVREIGDLVSADGYRVRETLLMVLRGQAQPGDFIVREGGVSATINGQHIVFGQPAEDGPARFITGATLSAIVAEFQGAPPAAADAVAAITRIRA